jgi:isoleucyl-tRNA synthetase
MEELDRWVLNRLQELSARVLSAYEKFDFHIVYHNLHNFCVLDLSSFYLDIIKDRLYTSPKKSLQRRSAQTAMNEILEVLVRLMAPVLSFTADEVWGYMKGKNRSPSVHMECFLPVREEYRDPDLSARWERIISVRKEVTKALEVARKNKEIGHSLDASVELGLSQELMDNLSPYKDQLRSIFIVSSVKLVPLDQLESGRESETVPGLKVNITPSADPKCERCWVHDLTIGQSTEHPTLCKRCVDALEETGGQAG